MYNIIMCIYVYNIIIPCFQFVIPVVEREQDSYSEEDTIEKELRVAEDELSSIHLEGSQGQMEESRVQPARHPTSTPLEDGKLNT